MEKKEILQSPVEVKVVEIPLLYLQGWNFPPSQGGFSRQIPVFGLMGFFPRLEGLLSVCREGSSVQVLEV